MKKLQQKQIAALVLALVILGAGIAATMATGRTSRDEHYDTKLAAAQQMQACMDQIRTYKQDLGIPLLEEDFHHTGMLGQRYTGITTTQGALEAKRTTANSDMAAMVVQMLVEAGVRAGDTVGAGFSGSFPSLDLAVLSACEAMGVKCIYIASVGSSTYGANDPELTFPDMALALYRDGLIHTLPAAFTAGGASDVGTDMDQQLLQPILTRLEASGVPVWRISDYQKNLETRMDLYRQEGPIACFIGVGGNITTSGRTGENLGQGVLKPDRGDLVTDLSGLVEIYQARGLPVINLLNVKKLVADYGLPFDPETLPEPGTSAIYYSVEYSRVGAALALAAALAVLGWGFRPGKKRGQG